MGIFNLRETKRELVVVACAAVVAAVLALLAGSMWVGVAFALIAAALFLQSRRVKRSDPADEGQ